MTSSLFANAHDFSMHHTQMNEITINTQSLQICNNHKNEPSSPIRTTMPCTTQIFTGQKLYLERLHQHFENKNPDVKSERKMFLLYGMGGIGKTQIALKFIDEMTD
ncbi:hypothetical protein BDQ17DRAFT_900551 [Cyathus striatus]|nr:hypothetical protein BDQ17DRAFT_900551 [Cyathus striatus]